MVEINENTKLMDLLKDYPWLKNELPKKNKKFRMLKTPLAKVMMRNAVVGEMSRRSGMEIDQIINMLTDLIESH